MISGELTVGQARPLLAIEKIIEQKSAADYIIKEGLNARQVEQYIKKLVSKKENSKKEKNIEKDIINKQEIKFVQDKLRTSLGTKVILSDNNGKGKITIEYYSADERERIIEFLTSK